MIEVLPYVELDGKYTVEDEVVRVVFFKMLADETFQVVFYDGTVETPEAFINLLRAPHNYPVFVFVDQKIGGVAWINDAKDNHATAHFCVFREHWGKESVAMGKAVLDYWFSFTREDGSPMFDVILGVTPAVYKPALRFITQLGFKVVGEVPKVIYNAYTQQRGSAMLSYCERPS